MSYRKLKKANVYITNGFKKIFYGVRTLYVKDLRNPRSSDFSGKVYVRYKNKYYQAHLYRHTYNVRIR